MSAYSPGMSFSDLRAKANDFFFAPASARPLAALRIGVALVLLVQAFLLRGEVLELFSSSGYVQGALAQAMSTPFTPSLTALTDFLARFQVSEDASIYLVAGGYVVALGLMAVGLFTRSAVFCAWFFHWMLMNSNDTSNYGVDLFAHVFLFYLMISPSADALSLDVRLGRRPEIASTGARLCLRLMQLHLCIMYLASGIEKASGIQWWNGDLLWRALTLPVYKQFDMTWLIDYPLFLKLGGWATLFFELGYCVFIWPKWTRPVWIVGMVGLHLGIAIFLGLGVFGCMMAVLTPALFAVPAAPVRRVARAPQPESPRQTLTAAHA